MNIRELIESRSRAYPNKAYLFYEDRRWTYRQFNDRVNQAANTFLEMGVKTKDRVALMLGNSPNFLFAWLGLNKIGAVMVPINTGFKKPEVSYIIDHCSAIGLVVSPETYEVADSVQKKLPCLKWLAGVEATDDTGVLDLSALWDKSSTRLKSIELHDHDLATVIYTSGTTGPPKGVMHGHRSYVLCGYAMIARSALTCKDRLMVILPFFHANAQFYSTMGSLTAGASLIVIPRFSARRFWYEAREYQATQFAFVGAIGRILVARPVEEFDPQHIIRVANGALIPEDVHATFTGPFNIPHVIDGYGLTECPGVSNNPIEGKIKIGSMGLPAQLPDSPQPFSEMRIIDDIGHDLPPNRVGELIVRSPVLMQGYYNDPQQTAEVIRDGWFHTGDYCYRDDDGYYFFVDRKKDIIRRKGENISSVEVETVINAHPHVLESAVVPVKSPMSEDEVKAFVVPKQALLATELIDWCKARLADFKLPRYVVFRTGLPKTPTQRIAKYLLKQESKQEEIVDMASYIEHGRR